MAVVVRVVRASVGAIGPANPARYIALCDARGVISTDDKTVAMQFDTPEDAQTYFNTQCQSEQQEQLLAVVVPVE